MPARKILIIAGADGLILSPIQNPRSTRSPPSKIPPGTVRIEYKTTNVIPHLGSTGAADKDIGGGLQVHGIVGLLNVSPTNSFLIAITDRKQVATIKGQHAVYVITNVALIPVSSRQEAAQAIGKARTVVAADDNVSDTETDAEEDGAGDDEVQDEISEVGKAAVKTAPATSSTIGEDVIGKKGAYGRFAERWFSKRGWTVDRRRSEGMSAEPVERGIESPKPENQPAPPTIEEELDGEQQMEVKEESNGQVEGEAEDKGPVEKKTEEVVEAVKETVTHSLTPKLLHTTKLLLAHSRSFYFSYDWDITRSWSSQQGNGNLDVPLSKIVDPLYFWNKHLQKPFIDAGLHSFVLPLMQGFVAQTTFSGTITTPTETDEPAQENLILTLISRRSTRRAGLRYLRRGVDDQGHTANSVETEQLLSTTSWDHVFSYLQLRGSIPLFFSQSPYSFRPRPQLLLSDESNLAAMRLHFKHVRSRYGDDIHIVNLVEKHPPESIVGDKYRDYISLLNSAEEASPIGWTWFDFHKECRGMRFENVSRLFTEISTTLQRISYTEWNSGSRVQQQKGVLRTNCMDCLDRTNVVQSGSARIALESQLSSLGVSIQNSEEWFNTIWADNGDAISQQYASTAALKGDFTRTRKRNLQGALTDLGLTMTRYFTNIISDYFTQAAIDFLLGNVTSTVFVDFEAEMVSADPAISMHRVRQNAIEVASKIVVADESEAILGGWTFLSPVIPGEKMGRRMVEKVLLLTELAVYRCVFDWALEKVSAFERVPVEDVTGITWGAYITSTLAPANTDPERNVGFLLRYRASENELVRVNTRSLQSQPAPNETDGAEEEEEEGADKEEDQSKERFWAFKAAPDTTDATQFVKAVCMDIAGAAGGVPVTNADVVSLQEARKGTGLVERWGYRVKKLVWA